MRCADWRNLVLWLKTQQLLGSKADGLGNAVHREQALKANPECAPRELKVNANYIGRFGQVALTEALDMVYDLAQGREITITY